MSGMGSWLLRTLKPVRVKVVEFGDAGVTVRGRRIREFTIPYEKILTAERLRPGRRRSAVRIFSYGIVNSRMRRPLTVTPASPNSTTLTRTGLRVRRSQDPIPDITRRAEVTTPAPSHPTIHSNECAV